MVRTQVIKTIVSVTFFIFVIQNIFAQTNADSLTIYKSINLNEVSVKGNRPIIKDEGSLRTVLVKGTMLAEMGSLKDVLRATPGLIMKGEKQFEVIGKGVPKYYIDGKEVTKQDVLSSIRSNNIAKIEIESEPSAKYPVGTEAVINVITIKPIKDMVSLNFGESMSFKRKFSNNPSLSFLMKKGSWTTSIDYDYSDSRNLNKETYFKEIYHPETTFRTDEANQLLMKNDTHSITWGNDFQLSDKHRLSFEYYFEHEKEKDSNDEVMSYSKGTELTYRDIYRVEKEQRNLHNFSLAYSGELGDNSSLDVSADYSKLHSNKYTSSLEQNRMDMNCSDVLTQKKSKYDILTLNASYSTTLFDALDTELGARYYNTHQVTDYNTNNPSAVGENAQNQQELSDEVTAAYISLKRKWNKVTLTLGGRYEYANTDITATGDGKKYSDSNYSSVFLPSVRILFKPIKGFSVLGVYRRSVDRPGYMGLNPYQVYEDSLSYSMGNRDLRPGITDQYALYFYWKYFKLYGGYSHTKNEIVMVDYCQNLETNQIASMPVNFRRTESYFIGMGYSQTMGKLRLSATGVIKFPKCSYLFLEQECKASRVLTELALNMYYTINRTFKAISVFTYQSAHDQLNYHQKMANNWCVGLQKSLWDDRLVLNLNVTDILHKAHYNNITRCYINAKTGTFGTNDMRGISLSASFKLFNKEISVEASRNSDDVLNRTY